jgi:SprT-like family
MFRALMRLIQRGIFDPAQLTLRLFGPDDTRVAGANPAPPTGTLTDILTERPRHVRPRRAQVRPRAMPLQLSVPAVAPRPSPGVGRMRTPASEDAAVVATLVARHAEYNASRFGGVLQSVPIDLSRRMRSRLGYYRLATKTMPAIIMISRRHLRRHGWEEVFQTLLHEMVHQWQAESGHTVDHGAQFRAKSRAVGAVPRARRPVGGDRGRAHGPVEEDWGSTAPEANDVAAAARRGRSAARGDRRPDAGPGRAAPGDDSPRAPGGR